MSIYLQPVHAGKTLWWFRVIDGGPAVVPVLFERWANAARSHAEVVCHGQVCPARANELYIDELEALKDACSRCDLWAFRFKNQSENVALARMSLRQKEELWPKGIVSRAK